MSVTQLHMQLSQRIIFLTNTTTHTHHTRFAATFAFAFVVVNGTFFLPGLGRGFFPDVPPSYYLGVPNSNNSSYIDELSKIVPVS